MRTKAFNVESAKASAIQVFWEHGYEAASMQSLLNAMGISRSSFYDTFGDKHRLFTDCIREYGRSAEKVSAILIMPGPAKKNILRFFEIGFFSVGDRMLERGCLLVNTLVEKPADDPELVRLASSFLNKVRARFEQSIQMGIERGEINTALTAAELADYFMMVVKGMRVMAKEGVKPAELKHVVMTSMNILG